MMGKRLRMERLFDGSNAVIIAMDHGLFDGPIPGMINLAKTAAKVDPCVDGVLVSPGMLEHVSHAFNTKGAPMCVVRLNWSTVYCFHWNYLGGPTVEAFAPEEAVALGADVALVSLTLRTGSESNDAENVRLFRDLCRRSHALGLPVIGEYFPTSDVFGQPDEMAEELLIACRILAELGADMIKTFHTKNFRDVVAGCPIPIFGLGAEKLPTQREALKLAEREIADGAGGVVFGRNAIQVPNPPAFQRALVDVVKHGKSAAAAARKHKIK